MKSSQFINNIKPIKRVENKIPITDLGDISITGTTISGDDGNITIDSNLTLTKNICYSIEEIDLSINYTSPSTDKTITMYNLNGNDITGDMYTPSVDCIKKLYLKNRTNTEVLTINFPGNICVSPNGHTTAKKAIFDKPGNSIYLIARDGVWYVQSANLCLVDSLFIPF